MDAKNCRVARWEIDNAELGQRLGEDLESHIAGCATCAEFRLERSQLRELVGSLKPVAAPADFDMRLRARIAREKDSRARQPFIFRFALSTPGIAIAATLVLMIAAAVWINQRRPPMAGPSVATGPRDQTPTIQPATNQNVDRNDQPVHEVAFGPAPVVKRPNQNIKSTKIATPTSSDFTVGGARSIGTRSDRDGEVSLTAPSQPMVVTVEDASGAKHKILLPPVSFGAQRFDSRTPVSMSNRKDW